MKRLLVVVLLVFSVGVVGAQDGEGEAHPLLEMLGYVPLTDNTLGEWISYTDVGAATAARNIETPESWTAFLEAGNSPWFDSFLPGFPQSFKLNGARFWQEKGGFDITDIQRTLTYADGADAVILQGDFVLDSVDAALLARDYARVQEGEGFVLWCWTEGCDRGGTLDRSVEVDPFSAEGSSNPFGEHPGRREPVAFKDGYLLNSPSDMVLQTMLDTGNNPDASLIAQFPAYGAAASYMVNKEGFLRQAYFVGISPSAYADPMNRYMAAINAGEMTVDEALAQFPEDYATYGNLPPYETIAIVDTVNGSNIRTEIVLVYPDEALAQEALGVMLARLPGAFSSSFGMSFLELITDAGGTLAAPELVMDAETGKSLLVIPFESVMPDNTPDEDGNFASAGRVTEFIYAELNSRGVTWLIIGAIPLPG